MSRPVTRGYDHSDHHSDDQSENRVHERDHATDDYDPAKRQCATRETWTVRAGEYVCGSFNVNFQARGDYKETDGLAEKSGAFAINAKMIDARNDESLGPEAREFYDGADLRFILWTVRTNWGVFETDDTLEVGEVEVGMHHVDQSNGLAVEDTNQQSETIASPSPQEPNKEWLLRRDFAQIVGLDTCHFGHVKWIELSRPIDIEDDEVRSFASRDLQSGELCMDLPADTFRHYFDRLWTERLYRDAAARVRTIYVANKLASMGVSLSEDGKVTFASRSNPLGGFFEHAIINNRSTVVPFDVFTWVTKRIQFIYTACSKWKEMGLATSMIPFPFGSDGPERRAFGTPAPAWYMPVMAFSFMQQMDCSNRRSQSDDDLSVSTFNRS